jgi:hypothetical protein
LHFIQSKLEIGKVYVRGASARFEVINFKETSKIIDIFSGYPLNSTKFLNFQDFKKAFEIYTSSRLKTPEIIDKVEKIRMGMNTLRPKYYSTNIGAAVVVPQVKYENADQNKLQIIRENRGKAGVYR